MKRSAPTRINRPTAPKLTWKDQPSFRLTIQIDQTAPIQYATTLATAAPVMPRAGTGPAPKIRIGSSTILMPLMPRAIQSGERISWSPPQGSAGRQRDQDGGCTEPAPVDVIHGSIVDRTRRTEQRGQVRGERNAEDDDKQPEDRAHE